MGLDFIKKAAPSFEKGWKNRKEEISTRTLFTVEPQAVPRSVVADLLDDTKLPTAGERLIVQVDSKRLFFCRDMVPLLVLENPPGDLLRQVEDCGNAAISTVERVNEFSNTVDVSIASIT
jgi:hypothetical protein